MTPDAVLAAIKRALEASEMDTGDVITEEPSYEGANNRLRQPWVTLQVTSMPRGTVHDTDRVAYVTDDAGNRVGRVFELDWEMDVQVDIHIAGGNVPWDATQLGFDCQQALRPFDSHNEGRALPDGDGGTVSDVSYLRIDEGRREDDLGGPDIRRWRQDLRVHFFDRTSTDGQPITTVHTPTTDETTTSSADGETLVWEYQP
ncbi:hypothetical protein J2752_000452 [Halarchaeum rubridurum]|uniref:Uncharacterized protein n=1 Tax=Halarchaeum rubridurum TaxID=489911 RepID=A0A830FZ37_9EURY|nr:hypothetical protein [Halarchaeum rubridurum]MBP1953571.1 hypothetical protein [Halarchaeum rubridurum]GGM64308.1 hypothetical protein GCM10009017_12900 [Halarchaeum rubridurum]